MDPRPRLVRSSIATALAVVLALGAAACGDDDDATATAGDSGTTASTAGDDGGDPYGSTSGGSADGDAPEGTIVAVDFSLTDVTVGPGEEITLQNDGDKPHTATADDGEFDLGTAEPGGSSEPGTAPEEPGSYPFHCEIHPDMTATLTVEG